jgi:polysaccharide pyruvyl transferase WcaK-like protein/SAM-dependent methyltransferase
MKILITNAVPLNGGDEALLRGLIESLQTRWPQSTITTLCNHLELTRQHLPDLPVAADLEFASNGSLRETSALYRQADIVLSAPGGFLHDFYPLEERLRGFEVALALRKPLILLGQSLGPFWKPSSLRRLPDVLNRVSRICVRDHASKEHLLQAGVNPAKISETADAAFLWRRLAPELFKPKDGPVRIVGLCFRAWPLDDTVAVRDTLAKADQLARFLLQDPARELRFISTCQGIPGYVDDSQLALQLVQRLPPELARRCQLNRARLAPRALIRALGDCDAFIGMRLHGCILSMLGGTPAMGLGYEQKTREIFHQLGLESSQVSFERNAPAWLQCAENFLADAARIRALLPVALDRACAQAQLNLDAIAQCLAPERSGQRPAVQPQSEWKDLVGKYDVPHLRLRQVALLVQQVAPRQVVDLGCATGQLHELCTGIEYVGCDFVAPEKGVSFPFYQCDFNRQLLPADLRELETIVCSGLLEYIEDLPKFLVELRSRLKISGYFIATYFNMNHVSRIWALLRGNSFPVRPDWRGFYSPRDFNRLVEAAGFELVQSVPMKHSLAPAAPVNETVTYPPRLPRLRPWSGLLAHQILLLAKCKSTQTPVLPEIDQLIPPGCTFILVDEAQLPANYFAARQPIPFLEKDGQYWGTPEDDETAIRECERLRKAGAAFIVFAPPAFWWLDYYGDFHLHLQSHYRCLLRNESLVIFDLRPL